MKPLQFIQGILENPRYANYVALIKFLVVGVLNTIISYVSYCLLVYFNCPWQIASPISYALGMMNSYLLNKIWTFKNKEKTSFIRVLAFILVNLLAWGNGYLILRFGISVIHLTPYIAQFPSMVVSTMVNFLGNRFFVFRRRID